MIRLSVLYPTTEGATFDHDYYRDQHVPLAVEDVGPRRLRDRQGRRRAVRGRGALHLRVDRGDAVRRWAAEGTGDVMADVANYTTITPVLQTSEIVG